MDPAEVRGARTSSTRVPAPDGHGRQLRLRRVPRGAGEVPGQRGLRRAARAEQAARRERGDVEQLGLGLCSYVEWTGFGSELGTCDGRARTARWSSPRARPRTARGTRRPTRSSWPARSASRSTTSRSSSPTPSWSSAAWARWARARCRSAARAVQNATDEVLDKARRLAAHLLEADAGDIEVVPGEGLGVAGSPGSRDPVGGARRARRPTRRARPRASRAGSRRRTTSRRRTRRTRSARISRSSRSTPRPAWRTCPPHHGRRLRAGSRNPMLVEGQVHGGIAQGVAQALFEEIAFDEDGNNVTGSLASYAIPPRRRPAELRDRAHADADAAQPAGGEGHRRVGRDRLDAGGLERRRRRARAHSACATSTCPRRLSASGRRSAPRADLAERARQRVDVRDRRPEPDARPDRAGQLGLAAGLAARRGAGAPRRPTRRAGG